MLTGLVNRRVLVTSLRAPGTTVDALGHLVAQLRRARADPSTGLFHGATAVAFALSCANHSAYAAVLGELDARIATLIERRLEAAHARIDRADLPALAEYDLISGLTGLGCYLLHRHTPINAGDRSDAGGHALLRAVLDYLVRLTRPLRPRLLDGAQVPGWWSGHDHTDRPSPHLPHGHANLGLAHGITGPLALLATALRHGLAVDGHAEAIDRICRWLDTWRQDHGTAAWWPERITADQHRTGSCHQTTPARPSWCYGAPGLARAQQLAALALDDQRRQRAAENALLGCVTDPRQLQTLTDLSLCHGWAGLLLTTARVAADAHTTELTERLPALHDLFDQHAATPPATTGLLEGAAGIGLVRASLPCGRSCDRPSAPASTPVAWDACLLTHGGKRQVTEPPKTATTSDLDCE